MKQDGFGTLATDENTEDPCAQCDYGDSNETERGGGVCMGCADRIGPHSFYINKKGTRQDEFGTIGLRPATEHPCKTCVYHDYDKQGAACKTCWDRNTENEHYINREDKK